MRLPFALVLLLPSIALAQTATLLDPTPDHGAALPPISAATADQATSMAVNPAGLVHVGAAELDYVHDRNVALNTTADGLYLGTGFGGLATGFSVDWVRAPNAADYRRIALALGLGSPSFSLGATYNWFSSYADPALDTMGSLDLGLLARPWRFLSVGLAVKNADAPTRYNLSFDRRWDLGVGLRPFGDRYTLAADYVLPESAGFGGGRFQYLLNAQVLPGISLAAGVSHGLDPAAPLLLQIGLTLDFGRFGVGYAAGGTPSGLDHVITARLSTQRYPEISLGGGKIALLDLSDRLEEAGGLAAALGLDAEDPYLRLSGWLDDAARDPDLRGLVIKLNNNALGLGRTEEVREAIFRLRANGKKVVAVVMNVSNREYLAATAADRIYAVPESLLAITGLRMTTTFLGGTMEKLGVHWDVARVGAYKNAPDQLLRKDMSAEQKEVANALLDTDLKIYREDIQQSRRLSPQQLDAVFGEGLITASRAKQLGIVDETITPDQLDEKLRALIPDGVYDPHYSPHDKRPERWGERARIAIVPVIGNIAGGKSRKDALGGSAIAGAETVVKALKRAEEDPQVAAIVLRVDSGGGDGLASDLMYRAVLEAKKKKPVIASMGDVAASGGYYASMGADEIWAEPTTITGSIGVFALKPALVGLADKLGISQQTISRAPLATLFDLYDPWTPEQQAAAQRWVESFYDDFITEVANSRKLQKAQVDAIARGHVWSGADAHARGLVDQLGGLEQAIASAKKRAGLAAETVDVEVLGEPHGLFSSAGGEEGVFSAAFDRALERAASRSIVLPPALAELSRQLGVDSSLLAAPGVKAMMDARIDVR